MATIVNVHNAKAHLSQLMERAHNGEEIILAKAGKPYARLVPLENHQERFPEDASLPVPLGTRLAQRFAGIGLEAEIAELRGESPQPAVFDP